MPNQFTITITSPDGTATRDFDEARGDLPGWVAGVSYGTDRFGGYGDATIPTSIPMTAVPVSIGDIVRMRYGTRLLYDGDVSALSPAEAEPKSLSITCQGVMQALRRVPVNKPYAFPVGGVDVGAAFGKWANENLLPALGVGGNRLIYSVETEVIGTTMAAIDGQHKLAGGVIDEFISQCGNLATIGCDLDANGRRRLYIRLVEPASPPAWVIAVPDLATESASGEDQSGDIINAEWVFGGASMYPQMFHNGSAEMPVSIEDGIGNLIPNGGFDDGDFHVATGWTLSGGATPESGKNTDTEFAAAFNGPRYMELDHTGEYCTRTIDVVLVAGDRYNFTLQNAEEILGQTALGTATLKLYDAVSGGGSLLDTVTLALAPSSQIWQPVGATFTAPAGVLSVVAKILADSIVASGGAQGALVADDVELYSVSVVYQDGLQAVASGSAVVNVINWVYDLDAYHGKYCIYLDCDSDDIDYQSVELGPLNGSRFPVQGGVIYEGRAMFKSPPSSPNPDFPKILLIADWYDSRGSYISQTRVNFAAPGGTLDEWTEYAGVYPAPGTAATCWFRVIPRSDGSMLVDAISFRNAAANTATDVTQYLPEGDLVYLIRCDDPYLQLVYLPSTGEIDSSAPVNSTAGVADPVSAPTVAAAAGATYFLPGVYDVAYTYEDGSGETLPSPRATVTLTYGQQVDVDAITPPMGATGVKWYVSINPGSHALCRAATNDGSALSLTTFPDLPDWSWSIARFGVRGGEFRDQAIIDVDGACAVAVSAFRAKADRSKRPNVTILDSAEAFWPGDSVLLTGPDGDAISGGAKPLVRERGVFDGILRRTLSTEEEPADETVTTKKLIHQQMAKYVFGPSTGFGPSGYGSATGSGGGVAANLPQFVDSEVAAGTVDGTIGGTFTLDNSPSPAASLRLYMQPDGRRLVEGTHYSLSGATITTLNFAGTPQPADGVGGATPGSDAQWLEAEYRW